MHIKLSFTIGFIFIMICPNNLVRAGLSNDVINLFEEFRSRMCHPFPQWKLPALDPYEIKHNEIYMDNNILKNFTASVTDLKATGLSDFIINEVKITTLTQKFKFNLTLPLYELQSQYTAMGSIANILNLVGDDNINGHLKQVGIIVTGGIKIGLTFGIKNLNIKISIGELFIDIGKIMEHERLNKFIHNLINDLTIELFGDFWDDYGETLTKNIQDIINVKMSRFTLKDVIGMISGSGQPIFGDNPPGDCKKQIL